MQTDISGKKLQSKLKEIIYNELDNLPAQLEALPPAERVKAVIQMLPYVSPKVQTCSVSYCDGMEWGM